MTRMLFSLPHPPQPPQPPQPKPLKRSRSKHLSKPHPIIFTSIFTISFLYFHCIFHTRFAFWEFIPWRIVPCLRLENSYRGEFIPSFRRLRHLFSLIIQVINSLFETSRFYSDSHKRISNYIITIYIKPLE